MADAFVLDLELGLNVDKSKIAQQLSKIISETQKDADGNKIKLGAEFKKDLTRDIGKQLANLTKNLKPAELDKLFDDEKIKKEILEIVESIDRLEAKMKELSSAGDTSNLKLKKFNATDISNRINEQIDYSGDIYNEDFELDFNYKDEKAKEYAEKAARELFDEINSIFKEYDSPDKIKKLIEDNEQWYPDLKKIGKHFNLELNFEPYKQDNSALEALAKERDELFERLSGKYMEWTNVNFDSIVSKLTAEVEMVPKLSDSFKADVEKLIEGLDLKAEVNLVGKVGEDGFIDAEQLEQALSGITQAFSNMQKDGKFSLDLINKEDIDAIKGGIKELNNFTDMLKVKKKTEKLASNGKLLKEFLKTLKTDHDNDIFGTIGDVYEKRNKNGLNENSDLLEIINPNTGEVYTSYNDIIHLLKQLAEEYDFVGEKANLFNKEIETASKGMKNYESLNYAWEHLSDHINDVTGSSIFESSNTGEYYKEIEKTSTVFNQISGKISSAISITSGHLSEIVEKLKDINNKNFNVTIDSMNALNSATENTVNNISQLGTVLRMIADADKIIRELNFNKKEPERVNRERALLYNSETGKISNPFVWDSAGHVSWDTYRKLGFDVGAGPGQGWDTMIHNHAGDDVLIPSMSKGDMSVAIQRYKDGLKNQIIVATDEIMHLNMDEARKAFEKNKGNAMSDDEFEMQWIDFVFDMEDATNSHRHAYMNYDNFKYYVNNNREFNIGKEDAFYNLSNERINNELSSVLQNHGIKKREDRNKYYDVFEKAMRKLDGKEINKDTSERLKNNLINEFAKISNDLNTSKEIVIEFGRSFLSGYMNSFSRDSKSFTYGDTDTVTGKLERNYLLELKRPGLDKVIKDYGLQDAFKFYSPEDFEKKYNMNIGVGTNTGELNDYADALQRIEDLLDKINSKDTIDINFGENFQSINDALDTMQKHLQDIFDFIDKLNLNNKLIDVGESISNPLYDFLSDASTDTIEDKLFKESFLNRNLKYFDITKSFDGILEGTNLDVVNEKLKEYFDGYNVTYESIVSTFENMGKQLNLLSNDQFLNRLNYLKNQADIIRNNQYSSIDRTNMSAINQILKNKINSSGTKLSSDNIKDYISPLISNYTLGSGTIFDAILNSINKKNALAGTINLDGLDLSGLNLSGLFDGLKITENLFGDAESLEKAKGPIGEIAQAVKDLVIEINKIKTAFSESLDPKNILDSIESIKTALKDYSSSLDGEGILKDILPESDMESLSKLSGILNEIKTSLESMSGGFDGLEKLDGILTSLKFEDLDAEKFSKFVEEFNSLSQSISGSPLGEDSFIIQLNEQLKNLIALEPNLKNVSEYLKELKDSADLINKIPKVDPTKPDGSGASGDVTGDSETPDTGRRKRDKTKKPKDKSEIGKQLDDYEKEMDRYYRSLEKMAWGTATGRDRSINTSAHVRMVELEEQLANATSMTNEQQERYNNLLNESKASMEKLNSDASRIADLLFADFTDKVDINSKAFEHIKPAYEELQSKIGGVSNLESLDVFRDELRQLSRQNFEYSKMYDKFSKVEGFDNYSSAINKLKQEALSFGRIMKEAGDIEPNGNGIANYTITVKTATGETKKFTAQWNEAIKSMGSSEKLMGNQGRFGILGFFDNVKKKIYDVTSYMAGLYLSPMDWIRYVQEGIQYVREMDTALTEMRKVSNESLESLQKYQMTTFDTAQRIGTTATDLQTSTADWMRLNI